MIELVNIHKSYHLGKEEVPILKDINLKIYDGEFVAIMGPSGSGKSTLMNIIGCLDRSSSGSYLLNEQEISTYSDEQLAKVRNIHIGFVFSAISAVAAFNSGRKRRASNGICRCNA